VTRFAGFARGVIGAGTFFSMPRAGLSHLPHAEPVGTTLAGSGDCRLAEPYTPPTVSDLRTLGVGKFWQDVASNKEDAPPLP